MVTMYSQQNLFAVILLQSACGLCVSVGSFSDPQDIPGIAHLLEHSVWLNGNFGSIWQVFPPCAVVFMGSDKFPGDNALDVLTNRYGGFDNAFTDYERVRGYYQSISLVLLS